MRAAARKLVLDRPQTRAHRTEGGGGRGEESRVYIIFIPRPAMRAKTMLIPYHARLYHNVMQQVMPGL